MNDAMAFTIATFVNELSKHNISWEIRYSGYVEHKTFLFYDFYEIIVDTNSFTYVYEILNDILRSTAPFYRRMYRGALYQHIWNDDVCWVDFIYGDRSEWRVITRNALENWRGLDGYNYVVVDTSSKLVVTN